MLCQFYKLVAEQQNVSPSEQRTDKGLTVDSRGVVEKGSVRRGGGGRGGGELTLWGCRKLDFIDGSGTFLIVIVAVQILFEQLIVTA